MAEIFASGLDFGDALQVSLPLRQRGFELLTLIQYQGERDDPVAKDASRFEQAASAVGPDGGQQSPVLQHHADQLRPEHGHRFERGRSWSVIRQFVVRLPELEQ